jgi:peptidoglycan DL-endopeptidase LytE
MGISGLGGIDPSQLVSSQFPVPATVGPGSAAKDVQGVQESLKQLGYKLDPNEDKADSYGASTQAAVGQFQKDNRLPVTGVADGATQLAMAKALQQKEEAEREKLAALAQLQKGVSSFGR